jgi:hypothetical protein
MMARMGGAMAGRRKKQRRVNRRASRNLDSEADGPGDPDNQEEDEQDAQESRSSQIERLQANASVVEMLNAEDNGVDLGSKAWWLVDPTGGEPGYTNSYLRLAWRMRRLEQSSFFQTAIMIVILVASVLVGLNTYEVDHHGHQQLSANVVASLATVDSIILIIFWSEIGIKVVGEGLKPWRFFCVGWCAPPLQRVARPAVGAPQSLPRSARILSLPASLPLLPRCRCCLAAAAASAASLPLLPLLRACVAARGLTHASDRPACDQPTPRSTGTSSTLSSSCSASSRASAAKLRCCGCCGCCACSSCSR